MTTANRPGLGSAGPPPFLDWLQDRLRPGHEVELSRNALLAPAAASG